MHYKLMKKKVITVNVKIMYKLDVYNIQLGGIHRMLTRRILTSFILYNYIGVLKNFLNNK